MEVKTLVKQPWFWILIGIVLLIGLIFGVYFYGKSQGRGQRATEFDKTQAELLKKAQEAMVRADEWKDKAENNEAYAESLKQQIGKDRETAVRNERGITEAYLREQQEINQKYEDAKKVINSELNDCDRCTDLCRRSNELYARYGEDFASAKCDPAQQCQLACNPGHFEESNFIGPNNGKIGDGNG
jgi:hypothetical protein